MEYEDGIYTDAGGLQKEAESGRYLLLADIITEVVAHLNHIHA